MKIPKPLPALRRIEKLLRGLDAYYYAMDKEATIGLGEWIRKVVLTETRRKLRSRRLK